MAFFLYASFPNSRGRPRDPTISANTFQIALNATGGALVKIGDTNLNRTYLTIENLSAVTSVHYLYAKTIAFDPTVVPLIGVINELAYNVGTATLYQKQDDGITTNWVVVLAANVAETIFPEQVAQLNALGEIWGVSAGAVGVTVGIDEGRG